MCTSGGACVVPESDEGEGEGEEEGEGEGEPPRFIVDLSGPCVERTSPSEDEANDCGFASNVRLDPRQAYFLVTLASGRCAVVAADTLWPIHWGLDVCSSRRHELRPSDGQVLSERFSIDLLSSELFAAVVDPIVPGDDGVCSSVMPSADNDELLLSWTCYRSAFTLDPCTDEIRIVCQDEAGTLLVLDDALQVVLDLGIFEAQLFKFYSVGRGPSALLGGGDEPLRIIGGLGEHEIPLPPNLPSWMPHVTAFAARPVQDGFLFVVQRTDDPWQLWHIDFAGVLEERGAYVDPRADTDAVLQPPRPDGQLLTAAGVLWFIDDLRVVRVTPDLTPPEVILEDRDSPTTPLVGLFSLFGGW